MSLTPSMFLLLICMAVSNAMMIRADWLPAGFQGSAGCLSVGVDCSGGEVVSRRVVMMISEHDDELSVSLDPSAKFLTIAYGPEKIEIEGGHGLELKSIAEELSEMVGSLAMEVE